MPNLTKKIRIAHVLYSFSEIGGLENGVINIIKHQRLDRFCHIICSLTSIGEIKKRVLGKNVLYYALHKKEGNDFTVPLKLYFIFKRENIDIAHLRNWPTLVEGFIAAKAAKVKKIIYSEHGRHFEDVWDKQILKFHVKKKLLNKVDALLTVSNELASEIKSLYRLDRKINVIVNGVDCQRFTPKSQKDMREQNGLKQDEKIIGTVGRLDPGKNFHELIIQVLQHSTRYKLVIVGDGPERINLERLVSQYDAKNQIMLLGHRDDVPELLNCFDVFVLPSSSEGLSNVILEAMSCGLPVIAYDVGGNRELIIDGEGGYLVPLGDSISFMKAVDKTLKAESLKEEMGQFNRLLVERRFSINRMVDSYEKIYTLD